MSDLFERAGLTVPEAQGHRPLADRLRHPHLREVTINVLILIEVLLSVCLGLLTHAPVESAELVRVNHRQHLAEALADTSDSLRGISEGQLAPRHEFDLLAVHVN